MNKKKIWGTLIASLVITVSTSAIAFASENVSKSTKDVVNVKVEATKASPKAISNESKIKTVATTTWDKKLLDISDEKAVQLAKEAIKNTFGGDVDKEGYTKCYVNRTTRFKGAIYEYKCGSLGPVVNVEFDKSDAKYFNESNVSISLVDGKPTTVSFQNDKNVTMYVKSYFDENKLKEVALQFLKDKGLDTNYKNIITGGPAASKFIPENSVYFNYSNNRCIRVDVDMLNYKVFGYSTIGRNINN